MVDVMKKIIEDRDIKEFEEIIGSKLNNPRYRSEAIESLRIYKLCKSNEEVHKAASLLEKEFLQSNCDDSRETLTSLSIISKNLKDMVLNQTDLAIKQRASMLFLY